MPRLESPPALAVILVRAAIQFRSYRAVLRRDMLWPFTTCAVLWAAFSLIALDSMFRILSLTAVVGVYGPVLLWILTRPAQPGGPANGSQPVSPEPKLTSEAAGSRR